LSSVLELAGSLAALLPASEVLIGARPCAVCAQAGTVLFWWPAASLKNNPRLDGDVSQHARLLEGGNLLGPWRQHASRFQRFSGVGVPIPIPIPIPIFLCRLHGPNSYSETQASLIASVFSNAAGPVLSPKCDTKSDLIRCEGIRRYLKALAPHQSPPVHAGGLSFSLKENYAQ
jgi:hypothetical protein